MAYCVNCGVELANSEESCPLCNTRVVNPMQPDRTARDFSYPARRENEKLIKRRHGVTALAVALLLLIPIGLCMYANLQHEGALSWSLLVAGGEVLLFIGLFSPLLFGKIRPWLCVLVDGTAATALLLLVAFVAGGDWFMPLGFPLCAALTVLSTLLALIIYERPGARHIGFFIKTACVLLSMAMYSVIAEWRISAYMDEIAFPRWSIYVALPCLVMAMVSFVLHTRTDFKEKLRRRFFV